MQKQNGFKKLYVILVIFVLLFGIAIGGYLVLKSKTSEADILNQQISELIKKQSASENDDFDHDGLKNWEEETWRTNPNNPDTDGDGYLDGEEVASGYDPTKKAPGDELPDKKTKSRRPESGNLTQVFVSVLEEKIGFGQIAPFIDAEGNLLAIGSQVQPATQGEFDEALVRVMPPFVYELTEPPIKNEDIKIGQKDDRKTIEKYMKEFLTILENTELFNQQNESDETIMQKAIEDKDFTLSNIAALSYKQVYEQVLQLEVPLSVLDAHKNFIKAAYSMYKVHENMKEIDKDPLKTIIALECYNSKTKIDYRDAVKQLVELASNL